MARYRKGQEVKYQGSKWVLIEYKWRDYYRGAEVWSARNNLGEVWNIYLGGRDED